MLTGFIWLRIQIRACIHSNICFGSIKDEEFFEQLSDC
jgi:hypothetical protein